VKEMGSARKLEGSMRAQGWSGDQQPVINAKAQVPHLDSYPTLRGILHVQHAVAFRLAADGSGAPDDCTATLSTLMACAVSSLNNSSTALATG
jgi:hypothetical protein